MALLVFTFFPGLVILTKLFYGPGESWPHLVQNLLFNYTINSIWLIFGSTVFTFVLGVSSAWIISRYKIPFRSLLEWLLILPLAIPSYITAYAYAGVFDYGGPFSLLLENMGIELFKIDVMGIYGLVFVLGASLFPYVYVASRAVFLYQSNTMIEASRLLAKKDMVTFFKIVLPLARPAIFGGVLLVIMEVLNDYGAAKYYGVNTFTTGIFRAWFSLEEPSTAIYLSAILLLLVGFVIFLERLSRGSKKYNPYGSNNNVLATIVPSGLKSVLLFGIVLLPLVIGFVIPVLQLGYWGFLTYSEVLSASFFQIALQSFGIALVTALSSVVLAICILYFPKWNTIDSLKNSYNLAILGYAIPGAVLAIGVIIPILAIDRSLQTIFRDLFALDVGLVLTGSLLVLVYAYMVRFLAVAFNPILAQNLKIGDTVGESSRLLGKGNFKTFLKIELPLLKPGLLSAFILVFVDIMKELPLTLILKPYNVQTLAVKAYEYASDEQIMEASIPSLCIIATVMVPIILLNKQLLHNKKTD